MLYQGDCLVILPTLADASVDMVFADLPYGVTCNKWDSVIPYTQGTKSANYGKMTGATTISAGDRYPRSILRVAKNEKSIHPTQKPVALLEWLIKTYSNEGDTVLDPTMGSGTTGIACANTRREFIGIEMDAGYFTIASDRLRNHKQPPQLTLALP